MTLAMPMSVNHPAGPQAAHIDWLWDVMLWTTGLVYVIVLVILFAGVWRRRHDPELSTIPDIKLDKWVAAGVGISTVILFGLLVSSVMVGKATSDLSASNGITVRVTGYQWWWRFEYLHPTPSQMISTANELHVPVGRPVTLSLTSADVIHSFWAPNIHGKRDLIPGETKSLTFRVDKPGVFRGQCAEFCGLQHAHMGLIVVAEPQDKYDAWYSNQVKPAVEPQTDEQRKGQQVFLSHACVMCHTIRGTPAGARLGPDLTHLKSRGTIAAATLPNVRGHLGGWIANPQSIKAGVRMPPNPLEADELSSLLGYLESLQ
jgi:cytochrome c oxidase subunit II